MSEPWFDESNPANAEMLRQETDRLRRIEENESNTKGLEP